MPPNTYISQVHTLVGWEPGRYKDIELGLKTVIVGLNGTGKSRLATSLSLLISGKAPGEVFGKEKAVASAADLALLYPSGVPEVVGTLSDGTVLHPPAAKNAHPWSHPVRAISEALRGTPETASTFFAPFLIPRGVDISGRFPADVVIPGGKAPRNTGELTRAIEDAKSTINTTRRQIKDNEVIISSASGSTAATPGRIEELEAGIKILESQVAAHEGYAAKVTLYQTWKNQETWFGPESTRLVGAHAEMGQLWTEVQTRTTALEAAKAQWTQLRTWITANTNPAAAALLTLTESAAPGDNCCPACKTPLDREAWRVWARQTVEAEVGQLAPYRVQVAQMEGWIFPEENAVRDLQNRLGFKSETYNRDIASYNERKATFDKLPVPPVPPEHPPEGQSVQEIQDQLRRMRSVHYDAVKASGAADAPARAQRELLSLQKTEARWVAWLGTLEQVHQWLIEEGVAQFQRTVQAHMPPAQGASFRILLERESGAGLFRFGMEAADGKIQYLVYGAGRGIILYALASACLDLLPERERPRDALILLDEERSIDPNHLVALMDATAASPWQVVIMSTHAPARTVEGWVVRDLNHITDDGTVPEAVTAKRKKEEAKKKRQQPKTAPNATSPDGVPVTSPETLEAPPTSGLHTDDPDAMIPPVPDA